jgi:ribosomal protein S18 acetylase RimI-like enzyme
MVIRAFSSNVRTTACSPLRPGSRPNIVAAMHPRLRPTTPPRLRVRAGTSADIAALLELDGEVFAQDRMSRRSFLHFLTSPTAAVVVAIRQCRIIGSAVILFRRNCTVARLYSLAVAPASAGRGIGPAILAAAERTARKRKCQVLRLEVHERNQRAITCYRKAGYRQFGRYERYYQDKGHALRFEKPVGR